VEEAKLARAAVLNSKQVIQNGVQWLSDPYQMKVRDLVQSGKLGQVTKIEQVWNDNNHRWHDPKDPDVAAIREQDTDWSRWLLGKPHRPFDPWAYFEFRIYRDFSGGITSQWLTHGLDLVHFYTGTAIPDTMVAGGGIFGWPDIRQNPDTFQSLATFEDARLLHSFSVSLGNRSGDHTVIRGKEASLFAQGGEGSPRWFLIPEGENTPLDFYGGLAEAVRKGAASLLSVEGDGGKLPPTSLSDDSKAHLDNWIDCMRARNPNTNGNIHRGFWHSVGACMATRAYREGRKLYWNRQREEIVERPPAR
jgi:predicted dehydrogenase